MLIAKIGTDIVKRQADLNNLCEQESLEFEGVFELSNLSENQLVGFIEEVTMFGKRKGIIIDVEDCSPEEWKLLSKYFRSISDSPSVFIILSKTLSAVRSKDVQKYGSVDVYDLKKEVKKKESPLAFSITDAFLKKDKKMMWSFYNLALKKGEEVEQIHGALLWQVKCLALASRYSTAQESGLSSYVFSKSKSATSIFSYDDICRIAIELVDISHSSREAGGKMEEALEKWILSIK
jgi:DNA polymerase III delta subunit